MKRRAKNILLSACIVLLVAVSVLGTIAYLTDTDGAVNTFTVGKVDIRLDETKVNLQGEPLDKDGNIVANVEDAVRTKGNDYRLVPGRTYVKDPTVTVVKGSEESYIRMLVTINKSAELDTIFADDGGADLQGIFSGYNSTKWIYEDAIENAAENAITYEFRYFRTVDASDTDADIVLEPLFTSITIPGEITGEELQTLYTSDTDRLEISVTGHAIQAAGFDNADTAWTAFDEQINN